MFFIHAVDMFNYTANIKSNFGKKLMYKQTTLTVTMLTPPPSSGSVQARDGPASFDGEHDDAHDGADGKKHTTSNGTARATPVTPAHKSWTAFQGPVLYTGPSGLRDQRVRTGHEFLVTGENEASSEITSQMGYLNRAAQGQAFPKAKNGQVGEIGWLYDTLKVVKGI
ncbi:hypothetical protein MAR_009745 [Mya arenaria]|uniref:Uncharacterized protein n=1 Tax=Mya arenaria TaxID=6604 RepID=A0ABY7DZL4_MYAAR|nr:hypothetical protein MAR_009745 [Mya arenaria]